MAFKPVFDASNASPFKFDNKGAVLEGRYKGSFDYQGDYGPTKKHIFETSKGAQVVFGQRNLMQVLPSVKPGTMVRITYKDDLAPTKKGRQSMKLFTVEQDESNYEPCGVVELNRSEEPETSSFSNYEAVEEESLDEDDNNQDAAPAPRAAAPRQPAQAPSAASQAKVQELLNRGRNKTT